MFDAPVLLVKHPVELFRFLLITFLIEYVNSRLRISSIDLDFGGKQKRRQALCKSHLSCFFLYSDSGCLLIC